MPYLILYMLLEYRVKKTLKHPKADQNQRLQFQNLIECLEQQLPLVYIDESGFSKRK